jgi:rod shape-determining protein MreC
MVGQKTTVKWMVAVFALLILLLLPEGCTAPVKAFFRNTTTPIQSFFSQTARSLKAGLDTIRGFGGLAEENKRLYQEILVLQARIRVRENLEDENLELRRQLEFRNRRPEFLIPAEVAARTIGGWWQNIRLAKGRSDGIQMNQAVISPDGLIGKTVNVSAKSAEVLLLSDPACKVSARIQRTGAFGVVSGRGVNRSGYPIVQMQFIHKDTPVRVGDEVVASGLGGVFPRDVLIGYVESVKIEENGLYQEAELLPQAVVNLTDVVFVRGDAEVAP